MSTPFCPLERKAWLPPERMTGTEWAESYRVIGAKAAKPGPYRVDRTPYAAGIMDALTDDEHTDVAFMKPVQCGGTTIGENALGCWIDTDPSPIMIVFSNEEVTKKRMREDVIPLLRNTPKLAANLTARKHDVKTGSVQLRSCAIHTGWAGSPASLASVPIRRLILDEVDKYPKWAGREADAISLGKMRTRTFKHRKKIYSLSTPTLPTGPIARAIESCGDIRDWCPLCPNCEEYIRPDWEHVHYEGQDATDERTLRQIRVKLEAGEIPAYYTCPHCNEDIDSDSFWEASKRGGWVSTQEKVPGVHPKSRSVGFRLNGMCSDWTRVQGAAVEFVSARLGGLSKLQNFYNSILGVPFWGVDGNTDEALAVTPQQIFDLAREGGDRGAVPDWATVVVAGVDTGKRDHPYVVRAFGEGFRSQLLEYGVAPTADILFELLERTWHGSAGRSFKIRRMLIDSGGGRGTRNMSRTEEVYRIAQQDPAKIYAIKGHGGNNAPTNPITTRMIHYRPAQGQRQFSALEVRLSILDVGYFKDLLASYINQETWHPHNTVGRNYVMQMAAEHKVMVQQRMKPDGSSVEDWRWVIRAAGLPNHFWDCEVYAVAAAHMLGADEMVREPHEPAVDDLDDYDSNWAGPQSFTRGRSWI